MAKILDFPADPDVYQSLLEESRHKKGTTTPDSSTESVESRLLAAVRGYIYANVITSEETIYQTDRVAETSIEFVEQLCNIAGYLKLEDSVS